MDRTFSKSLVAATGALAFSALIIPLSAEARESSDNQQNTLADGDQDSKLAKQMRERDRKIDAQVPESQGGRLLPSAKLLTSLDDSSAQFTLSTHSEKASSLSNDDFALTLSAPLSKKSKRADFLTQDGLPSQFSAGITFSHSLVNLKGIQPNDERIAELAQEALGVCLNGTKNAELAPAARQTKCSSLTTRQLGLDYLDDEKKLKLGGLLRASTDQVAHRTYSIVSVSGNIGTQTFDYFDPSTLASASQRKTALSAGIWLGVLPHLDSHVFLIGGFEAKRDYNEADETTYCPTATSTVPVKCTTGAFAPPTEEIDYKLSGKVRYTGQIGPKGGETTPFGVEISASYDIHDSTWGVSIPVYIFIDKDNGLTGGLRGSYDSKKDKFEFGIFIGKTFDFLKL